MHECVCVCACAYKTFLELIIQKYFLNEPWEFLPALKPYMFLEPNLVKRLKSSLNLCSYYVIKMIEATQHKSALCTVINNTEQCPL